MQIKSKIKELVQENMFEIHESLETKDSLRLKNCLSRIYDLSNCRKEWEGHATPLQPFIVEFLGQRYRVYYIWNKTEKKVPMMRTEMRGQWYNYYRVKVPTKKYYNKKITIMNSLLIEKYNYATSIDSSLEF